MEKTRKKKQNPDLKGLVWGVTIEQTKEEVLKESKKKYKAERHKRREVAARMRRLRREQAGLGPETDAGGEGSGMQGEGGSGFGMEMQGIESSEQGLALLEGASRYPGSTIYTANNVNADNNTSDNNGMGGEGQDMTQHPDYILGNQAAQESYTRAQPTQTSDVRTTRSGRNRQVAGAGGNATGEVVNIGQANNTVRSVHGAAPQNYSSTLAQPYTLAQAIDHSNALHAQAHPTDSTSHNILTQIKTAQDEANRLMQAYERQMDQIGQAGGMQELEEIDRQIRANTAHLQGLRESFKRKIRSVGEGEVDGLGSGV